LTLVDVILYTGIFVFAVTGALKARAHRMDILGGAVLAFVTAYGGGTLRDLLMGVRVGWMNDNIPLILVAGAVVAVSFIKKDLAAFEKVIFFTDAIGLAMFTAGGIEKSLVFGISEIYSVLLGVMSATFGGLIADLLSGRTPSLFQKGELYATASAIGGLVYILLKHLNVTSNISLVVCVVIVVLVRIISRKRGIALPHI